MKSTVFIDAPMLASQDIDILNDVKYEEMVEFSLIRSKNFLPSELIFVLIDLGKNMSYSAAYDILKYILLKLTLIFSKKNIQKTTKIEIVCNKEKYSFSANFPLSKEQKDKFIDAAIEKLLKWFGGMLWNQKAIWLIYIKPFFRHES